MSNEQKLREALLAYHRATTFHERLLASAKADEALAMPTAAPVCERPDCFVFAMEFLGEPEASKLMAYVEQLEARAALSASDSVKPVFKVYKGEVCYKSEEDDQSYGMWCPVSWEYKPPFPEGTEFVAAMRKGQP